MGRRRIGQERLAVGALEPRGGTSLDEVAALVDWAELDRLLAGISASSKGEAGWPPLALFRAMLLATWHDLSDGQCHGNGAVRGSVRKWLRSRTLANGSHRPSSGTPSGSISASP